MNTPKKYREDLTKILKDAGKYQPWLEPAIISTAQTQFLVDKLLGTLTVSNLVLVEEGSSGQERKVINPAIPHIRDLQRTLSAKFTELGLNYQTAPSKLPKEKGNDPLVDLISLNNKKQK